jgi:hypothetical protein
MGERALQPKSEKFDFILSTDNVDESKTVYFFYAFYNEPAAEQINGLLQRTAQYC